MDLNSKSEQGPSPERLFPIQQPLSTHLSVESDHRTAKGQALFEWWTAEKRHDTDTLIAVAVI